MAGIKVRMAATRDGRPHRWVNSQKEGATVFVTTTCLDFVPAFSRSEMRELAAVSILHDCQHYHATLHAFVVMTHHVHLLLACPQARSISWLMQRIKSNLAKLALPRLDHHEIQLLSRQTGLNQKSLWRPSFRGLEVSSPEAFYQKVRYTHLNPVRAKLVTEADNYRWSSRRFWNQDLWHPDLGLDLDRALVGFDESLCTRVAE